MLDRIITMMLGSIFRSSTIGLRSPTKSLLVAPQHGSPVLHFRRWRDLFRLPFSPELTFGEAFANGHLDIEDGDVYDVVSCIYRTTAETPKVARVMGKLSAPVMFFLQGLNPKKSKANVAAHYDLGNALYDLFLDDDKQYSCAYFHDPSQDLATAQQQKKNHIIKKLLPERGMTTLDIGCGWGGLSLDLARAGLAVTGITLSEEQFSTAQERGRQSNSNVRFKLQDYRLEKKQYDRVVSVGMFEHVGKSRFQEYFNQVAANLKDDGIALIHTIDRPTSPTNVNRFITKYIFPGGYIPSLSQMTKAAEKSGLLITDIECLYLHYAETLRHWRMNFLQNREAAIALYDERFARIWELYLAGCEATFRAKNMLVFQVQLRKAQSPVSLTRDYLYTADSG
jgi:cyclopropane-fatty-acyl-phospholipid synthase